MKALYAICQKDKRYDIEAYLFLREALEFTVQKRKTAVRAGNKHVSGQELAEGFREYVIAQFGPITFSVLAKWGLHKTEDIGAIVFNMVNAGELGKTDQDKPEDFDNLYDFHEVFEKPFLPVDQTGEEIS
jgi:uncharacterized repeat protein (TIGR04138 family)